MMQSHSIPTATSSLGHALQIAINACAHPEEEEGGLILQTRGDFFFIQLRNNIQGTERAHALYVVDPVEYASVILPLIDAGWTQYATFHTHPKFSPQYSSIDYTMLFQSAQRNFIYSKAFHKLVEWVWINETELSGTQIKLCANPAKSESPEPVESVAI